MTLNTHRETRTYAPGFAQALAFAQLELEVLQAHLQALLGLREKLAKYNNINSVS